MPLPDFLIIGAQKAGSTWLQERLRAHPDVFMPEGEIHYFDKADRLERGPDWYSSCFEDANPGQIVGEKTPDYFWTGRSGAEGHLGTAHEEIHALLPEVRMLLTLRNPVDRAVSAVNHLVRTGRVSPAHSIDELLVGSKRALIEPHGVLDYGRYARHLERYLELFEREQIHILIFEEDIVRAPEEGVRSAARFVGVDPEIEWPGLGEKSNAPPVSRTGLYLRYAFPWARRAVKALDYLIGSRDFKLRPRPETRAELYEFYEPENRRLFDLIGREIPSWQQPPPADG